MSVGTSDEDGDSGPDDGFNREDDADIPPLNFPSSPKVTGSSKRPLADDNVSDELSNLVPREKKPKKRKLRKDNELKKLHKPHTVEELTRLRETENLFHSNLFRKQIEEMLKELEIKNKNKVRINIWFEKFKDWVLKIEDGVENHDLSSGLDWLTSQKVKLPLTQFALRAKGFYHFRKPTNVKLAGSYVTKTLLSAGEVDIMVEVPRRFFDKEDYLNGRYYRKRAIYLSELAKHLQAMSELVQEVKFSCNDGDSWRPVLEITPAGKLNKNVKFLVHLVAEKSSFRLSRFIPNRNNVRSRWFLGEDSELNDDECPTSAYNSGVLRDLRCEENEAYIAEVLGCNPHLRDAVVLLKVWARQRELHLGHGAFTGHLISFLIAYLLHIRKLNQAMSSYQILRTVWNYLLTADWARNGITLYVGADEQQPCMSEFHDNFPLVFVDPSGFLNLCAGMSPLIFRRCQDESALAIRCLDTPDINCFQVLFMTPVPFSRLCDQSIVFHNWEALEKMAVENSQDTKKLDFCGMIYPQVCDLLISLLEKGLGERVRRIFIKQTIRKTWLLNKKPPTATLLIFGLILDPEHCYSVVDKGPVADANEAEEFRTFWGELSELRRFKDGSITESVLWDAKTWQEKRMICRQVSQYLLKAKFGLDQSDFHYVGDELEYVLPTAREIQTGDVVLAYDNMMKTLRGLEDLPLEVISVQGASSVFRSSEVFPPEVPRGICRPDKKSRKKFETIGKCASVNPDAHLVPPWCAPVDVVIQLGSSNKWPRDLDAVRRIRAAFNLSISQLLFDNCGLVTQAFQDGVNVLTETCVFRLRIIYPGEIALMKKTTAPDGLILYRDTEESMQLEKSTIYLPKLTSALSGLQSQHSAYGTACCLAKRWVRAHLFHPTHICDEVIDLLMASVFVNPEPWLAPNQPQLAFLRFLSLLGQTNWQIEFVLLNFNQVLTREEKHEIESHFDNQRASLPCLFIATPDDRTRSIWTRDGPCPVVLLRLMNLAQRALVQLESQLTQSCPDISPIFKPSLTVFDVLINLVAGFVPKSFQALPTGTKNSNEAKKKISEQLAIIPVLGFDPVECYLKELRESYGEWALFFYDPYGGSTISVLWRPASLQPREFKVTHLHGRRWDCEKNTLHFDRDAILEGFHVLGAGLVKSVQLKRGEKFVPVHF